MKKINSISIKDNFIKVFTDKFLFKDGINDYSRICVVFPGKRPFLYLQRFLAEKIKASFYPPRMLTINEFINYITEKRYPGLHLINEIDGIWGLYNIIVNEKGIKLFHNKISSGGRDFFTLYPWVKKIYEFINQTDIEDVPDAVLKNIQHNAEIGYSVPDQINELFQNIVMLRKSFHSWLKENHLYTRGYSYLQAGDIIKECALDEFEEIYFTGLFALTGTEKQIIKKLLKDNSAKLIWHGSPQKWGILNDLQNYFDEEVCFVDQVEAGKKRTVEVYSAFDYHSESHLVYEILHKKDIIRNTAIVSPLNDTLFPILSFAVDRILAEKKVDKFNISLDYPVSKTSLFTMIKNLADCQISSRSKKKEQYFYIEAYLEFFNNPFIKNIQINKIFLRDITRRIRDTVADCNSDLYSRSFLKSDEIEEHLEKAQREVLGDIHAVFFHAPGSASTLKEICISIEKILDHILRNSEIKSYILSGEIFNLFYETLSILRSGTLSDEAFTGSIERKRLWEFFLRFMEDNSIRFNTVPLQDLEIIGMLETRNLNFEHVIILDMQEGIVPVEKKIDPLIPVSILEDISLPSPEFQQEIYEYYFYRLVENAKELHLLYLETPQSDRSRYIERMIWDEEKEGKMLNVKKINTAKFRIELMTAKLKDEDGIIKDASVMSKLNKMEFSPSAVDNFLFCQIKFYYSNILDLTLRDQVHTDIDSMDRGTIIHNILKDLFNGFKGRFLSRKDYPDVAALFKDIFKKQFGNKESSGEFYLFKKMAFIKLNQFLEDSIRNNEDEFKVIETEKKLNTVYQFDDYNIKVKGRIDRIDIQKSKGALEYLIIDYKTGNSGNSFGFKEALLEEENLEIIRKTVKTFQLPLYIYLYLQNNSDISLDQIDAQLVFLGGLIRMTK